MGERGAAMGTLQLSIHNVLCGSAPKLQKELSRAVAAKATYGMEMLDPNRSGQHPTTG